MPTSELVMNEIVWISKFADYAEIDVAFQKLNINFTQTFDIITD